MSDTVSSKETLNGMIMYDKSDECIVDSQQPQHA